VSVNSGSMLCTSQVGRRFHETREESPCHARLIVSTQQHTIGSRRVAHAVDMGEVHGDLDRYWRAPKARRPTGFAGLVSLDLRSGP
jgi:hypothetical protein